ncbi:flavin reductase family protein [Pseudoxanthobacter sp.]|uniref:flavin reductase family protein n=1 Tax=Pseudoxanthobacter sp. TaxID=1925742 RepID=UPI002FDF91C6
MDEAAFAAGMRRLAGGVALITTQDATGRHGLVATAVTALSAAPPSLLVCVNRAASAHTALAGAGVFCVNVLATAQEGLAAGFADPARRGERFATGTWLHGMTGAPVLAEALVTFECRVERVVEHGSHSVFMAAIAAIRHGSDAGEPLIYFNRGFRRLA